MSVKTLVSTKFIFLLLCYFSTYDQYEMLKPVRKKNAAKDIVLVSCKFLSTQKSNSIGKKRKNPIVDHWKRFFLNTRSVDHGGRPKIETNFIRGSDRGYNNWLRREIGAVFDYRS